MAQNNSSASQKPQLICPLCKNGEFAWGHLVARDMRFIPIQEQPDPVRVGPYVEYPWFMWYMAGQAGVPLLPLMPFGTLPTIKADLALQVAICTECGFVMHFFPMPQRKP